jgi:SAM-dependent methyltransferase
MNESHLNYLASPMWAATLETDLLPWIETLGSLGEDALEIGPGPGLTTDLLRRRVARLTAIEVDAGLAAPLGQRMAGTNVDVICADASASGLDPGRFTGAACFTMLHHVPSPAHQDRLFAEVNRVLRPGAIFVGTDSRDIDWIREAHLDDVFVPVDPDTLADRLGQAGFVDTVIEVEELQFRFVARKPPPAADRPW